MKTAERSKSLEATTFESCAYTTIDNLQHEWTNHKTKKQWLSSLKQYAFPVIGNRPVSEITKDEILEILKPIWFDKTDTADRVRCVERHFCVALSLTDCGRVIILQCGEVV